MARTTRVRQMMKGKILPFKAFAPRSRESRMDVTSVIIVGSQEWRVAEEVATLCKL